ncbi:MAG: NifU family protein [Planctomycetota bacterium]
MSEPLKITVEDSPEDSDTCVIAVNRPVSPTPLYVSTPEEAHDHQLALQILELGKLDALLLQDMTITLLKNVNGPKWSEVVPDVEKFVRAYYEEYDRVAEAAERPMTAKEEELTARIREIMENEINPAIASHGGRIDVLGVRDSTVYVHMGGGCQGCGMATVTLREGVEAALSEKVPEIDTILDTTDHAAGTNPYYQPR